MKVGDLVKQVSWDGIGIVTCIDPEQIGDMERWRRDQSLGGLFGVSK